MELASNLQAISITNQVPTIESSRSVRSEFDKVQRMALVFMFTISVGEGAFLSLWSWTAYHLHNNQNGIRLVSHNLTQIVLNGSLTPSSFSLVLHWYLVPKGLVDLWPPNCAQNQKSPRVYSSVHGLSGHDHRHVIPWCSWQFCRLLLVSSIEVSQVWRRCQATK